MQAKISVSLIFVGVVLLYLGIFGLVAPFRLAVAGTPENFTTYTEVDPNNHITVTSSTTVLFVAYQEIAYLYVDKGANYFGISFTHTVAVKMGTTTTSPTCTFWALTNDLGDLYGLRQTGKTIISVRMGKAAAGWYYFIIDEIYGGGEYSQLSTQADAFQADTWYYPTISKVSTYFKCDIYTDSARTILKKTLLLTLHADHLFRYIMPCVTYNYPPTAPDNGPIDIANLVISPGTPPGTGTIVVNAQYYDGTWKDVPASTVTVTCDGVQKQTPATFSSLLIGSHTINLVTTSITVSGVFYPFKTWEDSSVATTRTVSVASGETKTLTSYYAKEDVTPPSDDFWEILQQTFQNPIVKSILVLGGVLFTGIGAIGLVPKKKPAYNF